MDLDNEKMKFLGIFGIFRESINIIYRGRKIFTQITLSLILPLSFLLFAYFEILNLFPETTLNFQKPSSKRIYFFIFQFSYLILCTILSLLATSGIVYTVACIYTARDDVTFKHVMRATPKVWKRLFITFLCVFGATFSFIFVALILFFLIIFGIIMNSGPQAIAKPGIIITLSLLIAVFVSVPVIYMSIIWQLSSIVSVLEDLKGFKAMSKSKALLKGRILMATRLVILVSLPSSAIQLVFYYLVLPSVTIGVVIKGILGILCLLSFPFFFLFSFVTQTVLYLVCKSYHNESVEKSALSDHLRVYEKEEYTPLRLEMV